MLFSNKLERNSHKLLPSSSAVSKCNFWWLWFCYITTRSKTTQAHLSPTHHFVVETTKDPFLNQICWHFAQIHKRVNQGSKFRKKNNCTKKTYIKCKYSQQKLSRLVFFDWVYKRRKCVSRKPKNKYSWSLPLCTFNSYRWPPQKDKSTNLRKHLTAYAYKYILRK